MTNRVLSRYALSNCVAAAMLAGCGGSSQSIATNPQGSSLKRETAEHGKSAKGDLIYGAADGSTYVLSYPQGKVVGAINEGGADVCSDSSGNVYLTVDSRVDEFSHGATAPSASFNLPNITVGCAVDPVTGNLAVTYFGDSRGNVAIFPSGSSNAMYFRTSVDAASCGYDNVGNLFVEGFGQGGIPGLTELQKNTQAFETLTITPRIQGSFERVQWDGSYIALQSHIQMRKLPQTVTLNRLSASGSTATVVSSTSINGIKKSVFLSWIKNNQVIIPYGMDGRATPNIDYWKYPAGGAPRRTLKAPGGHGVIFNAVTVSVRS